MFKVIVKKLVAYIFVDTIYILIHIWCFQCTHCFYCSPGWLLNWTTSYRRL